MLPIIAVEDLHRKQEQKCTRTHNKREKCTEPVRNTHTHTRMTVLLSKALFGEISNLLCKAAIKLYMLLT